MLAAFKESSGRNKYLILVLVRTYPLLQLGLLLPASSSFHHAFLSLCTVLLGSRVLDLRAATSPVHWRGIASKCQ